MNSDDIWDVVNVYKMDAPSLAAPVRPVNGASLASLQHGSAETARKQQQQQQQSRPPAPRDVDVVVVRHDDDDEATDLLDDRSFRSTSIGRVSQLHGNAHAANSARQRANAARGGRGALVELNTHCYIFWDYENLNFKPKDMMHFLCALEAVFRRKLDSRNATFSVVACAPYFCFMDDKALVPDYRTREPKWQNRRLAGTALEILANANIDCKVVPSGKKEQADKKIILDKMIAAINPTAAHRHHFCVISSDAGFASSFRTILNVPAWAGKVSASAVHNLVSDASANAIVDLQSACGGANVHSVAELMREGAAIVGGPRGPLMLDVKPLPYRALWREKEFDFGDGGPPRIAPPVAAPQARVPDAGAAAAASLVPLEPRVVVVAAKL